MGKAAEVVRRQKLHRAQHPIRSLHLRDESARRRIGRDSTGRVSIGDARSASAEPIRPEKEQLQYVAAACSTHRGRLRGQKGSG